MAMKKITIRQIGWVCRGEAILNLWGSGQGTVEMKQWQVNDISRESVAKGLNDNGMGCESIESAEVRIFELYKHGVLIHCEDMEFTSQECEAAKRGI